MLGLVLTDHILPEIFASSLPKADRVVVRKSERSLVLYRGREVLREYGIALGDAPKGHKQQEGDERTPEGEYVLDWRNENSSFYKSIRVSYPNEQDKARAKERGVSPGGLIMIHGQRNYFGWLWPLTQRIDWTDGCIAVTNTEMEEIWRSVEVGTPITIEP
ncbi:MAG: L,D-transpeptidase family protein [Acidobacteriota bacterium]|nr:MAG: L,D-transpeptidase family protein [Acidobacteriota bacterium]